MTLNWFSFPRGHKTKIIGSCDNNVRAVETNVYQPNSDELRTV